MARIKLGDCPVDSGQILLVDPCYADEGFDYAEVCTSHKVAADGSVATSKQTAHWSQPYYEGVGGQVKSIHGVVTGTGWGDGMYPVYAEIKGGRVKSVTIEFMDDDDDDWY